MRTGNWKDKAQERNTWRPTKGCRAEEEEEG
jgi:hypothetical protein